VALRAVGSEERSVCDSESAVARELAGTCAVGLHTDANALPHPLRLSADLQEVVDAWPDLAEPIRAASLALVQTSRATR